MAVNILLDMKTLLESSYALLGPIGTQTHGIATPLSEAVKQVDSLLAAGWVFKHGILSITAVGPAGQHLQESMPVLISQVLAGKVPPTPANLFYAKLVGFIQKAVDAQVFSSPPANTLLSDSPTIDGIKVVKASILDAAKGVNPSPSEIKATVKAQAEEGKSLVTLAQATHLGQLVPGTNATSLYKVVALGDALNVAVRRTEGGVSIRVEGDGLTSDTVSQLLKSMGFTVGKHASIHATTSKETPYQYLVGAVMFGLGPLLKSTIAPKEIQSV